MHRSMALKTGFQDGLPVLFGYFPIAVAFGILAKSVGLDTLEAGLFSMIVYAGASQFVGANLLSLGVGMGEIVLTTFLLNFRHFVMSAAVASRLTQDRRFRMIAAFGVTDETFAVAMSRHASFGTTYLIALNLTAWTGWVSGTFTGHVAGGMFPEGLQRVMGSLLYVMFLGILVPDIRKDIKVLMLAVFSGLLHVLFATTRLLPGGWSMIAAIVTASILYELVIGKKEAV